jgi:hypothetical protein
MTLRKRGALLAAVAATVALGTATALAGDNDSGFHTSVPSMLSPVASGVQLEPIISVGDTLESGHKFESLPDGISLARVNGQGTADILVNHELSKVPFAGRSDFTNSLVSRLRLNQHSGGVLKGEYVIPSSAGYQRFCSNFVVGAEHGFERTLLLTNEEARDIVLRQEDSWHGPNVPPPAGGVQLTEPGAEQAGVVVAYDVKSGEYRTILGMGRHNHENDVGVPGYGHPVVLSGDDTFDAPASQLYLYTAASGADLWNDKGKLWVFVSDDSSINDYGDITEGTGEVDGHFVEVPRDVVLTDGTHGDIAAGKRADGTELRASDLGYPAPPTGIPDGPQWVLEIWSNLNNAFQFIRVEDIAYDRTNGHVVYFADTGEPRAVPDPTTGKLRRAASGTNGDFMNGRLFKLDLGSDPTDDADLSVLPGANFDLGGYANAGVPHQPDNVETTASAIYFQEDPGSHNGSAPPAAYPRFPDATNARIWRYDLTTHALSVVAEVDQSLLPAAARGAWESSGVVDVSSIFGAGTFLVDVQAHGLEIDDEPSTDPSFRFKREHGQLLILRVPPSTY